jgi:uncharacterized protein YjbI with pentapeptide repeats
MRHVLNSLNSLWRRTGFGDRTLWEWMSLLIVPVFIAGATIFFTLLSTQAEQQIEDDRVKQTSLESYMRDLSELMLHEGLFKPWVPIGEQPPDTEISPVGGIARAHTLTTVRQLDGERKGLVLQFLIESQLLGYSIECSNNYLPECARPAIDMRGADLRGTKIFNTILYTPILYAPNLTEADLSGSELIRIKLGDAILIRTDLTSANLSGTELFRANFTDANLTGANLTDTDLTGANFTDANLTGANLTDANLGLAPPVLVLSDPNRSRRLTSTNLSGVDLSNANLKGIKGWTNEQLAQAKSLIGATMHDGTKMTEEAWEEFKKRYR